MDSRRPARTSYSPSQNDRRAFGIGFFIYTVTYRQGFPSPESDVDQTRVLVGSYVLRDGEPRRALARRPQWGLRPVSGSKIIVHVSQCKREVPHLSSIAL